MATTVIVISNPGNETAFFIRLKIVKPDNELLFLLFLPTIISHYCQAIRNRLKLIIRN